MFELKLWTYILEEGEKEGLISPFIAPIRGRDIDELEFMVTLVPEAVQVSPEGREQETAVVENSAGKETTR